TRPRARSGPRVDHRRGSARASTPRPARASPGPAPRRAARSASRGPRAPSRSQTVDRSERTGPAAARLHRALRWRGTPRSSAARRPGSASEARGPGSRRRTPPIARRAARVARRTGLTRTQTGEQLTRSPGDLSLRRATRDRRRGPDRLGPPPDDLPDPFVARPIAQRLKQRAMLEPVEV